MEVLWRHENKPAEQIHIQMNANSDISVLNTNSFQACLTFSPTVLVLKGFSENSCCICIKSFYTFSEVDAGPREVELFAAENI